MKPGLRLARSTTLDTASAPVDATRLNGRLAVAASDLETQAARLWLLETGGELAATESLPLAHVSGLAVAAGRLAITGWTPVGEKRVIVGYAAGSVSGPIELPTRGDVARDPRPIVGSDSARVVWEEYVGDGLSLAAQSIKPDGRQGWRLDGEAIRRPAQPFAAASSTVAWGTGLVVARADEGGSTTVELLDAQLSTQATTGLPGDRSRVAASAGDRVVVASAGRVGEPVTLHSFDGRLVQIGDAVTLPVHDRRASVGALGVALAGGAPFAIVVQVETVLGDPEPAAGGEDGRLGPPSRRTTEVCTIVDLKTGRLSAAYRLDPPSYGGAVIVWHLDRIHLVHGSSPLHVTELAVTR